jgi:TolB-like protein
MRKRLHRNCEKRSSVWTNRSALDEVKLTAGRPLRLDWLRVRITAQLIDAMTGNHIWAERYNRELAGRGEAVAYDVAAA